MNWNTNPEDPIYQANKRTDPLATIKHIPDHLVDEVINIPGCNGATVLMCRHASWHGTIHCNEPECFGYIMHCPNRHDKYHDPVLAQGPNQEHHQRKVDPE